MSDVPEAELRETAADLERFVAIVRETTSIDEFEPLRPTRIVLFGSAEEYGQYRHDPNNMGEYVQTRDQNVMMFAFDTSRVRRRAVLFHEFVHHLLRNRKDASYPLWYEEGLAELLGSVTWRDDAIAVGMIPSTRRSAFELAFMFWVPIDELLSTTTSAGMSPEDGHMFYSQAWALVHYFHTSGPEAMAKLNDYLSLQRQGVDWRSAYRRVFRGDPQQLDEALRAHWETLRTRVRFLNLWAGALEVNTRWSVAELQPHDVAARLAELALLRGERGELAVKLVERGLETSPGDARLLATRALIEAERGEYDPAQETLRSVEPPASSEERAFVHFATGRVCLAQATASDAPDLAGIERARAAFGRAIESDPELNEARAQLALSYAEESWGGSPTLGLELLEEVARRTAPSVDIQLALGLVKLRLGREEEARRHLASVANAEWFPAAMERARRELELLEEEEELGGDH